VVVVVVLVALVGAAAAFVLSRRKSATAAGDSGPDASRSSIAPPAPMTGLESALDQAMDRSGRNMREKIEAEADKVEELRASDDTGPILRRALDRVEHTEQPPSAG
jgi:hypothetical protein